MKIRRILLTNDDGNNSIGSRLLVNLLKKDYEIVVAGPKNQQSSVGASISKEGFLWKKKFIDGITYYSVDGTPSDAMELLYTQNEKPFDIVISGINWGPNVCSYLLRSGTFNAMKCALGFGFAPCGIAISWLVPEKYWHTDSSSFTLDDYLNIPGKMADFILRKAINSNLWEAKVLNICLPSKDSKKIKFTKILMSNHQVYDRSWKPDSDMFYYKGGMTKDRISEEFDAGSINNGFISVSPCVFDLTDYSVLNRLELDK